MTTIDSLILAREQCMRSHQLVTCTECVFGDACSVSTDNLCMSALLMACDECNNHETKTLLCMLINMLVDRGVLSTLPKEL